MRIVPESISNDSEPCSTIRTTLYDLIEAIHSEVHSHEDHLVVAIVAHLLDTGRITFIAHQGHNN